MDEEKCGGLLESCLSWVDGLCAAYLAIQQNQCPEAFQGRGIVIPEAQVAVALSGQCPLEPLPGLDLQLEELLEQLRQRPEEPLAQVVLQLQLQGIELLAFLLALAPRINRKYERIFGYLQDDASAREATVGLCGDLWALAATAAEKQIFSLNDPDRPLNRFALRAGGDGLGRRLVLRESTLFCFLGLTYLPAALHSVCQQLLPGRPEEILAHRELICRAEQFAKSCTETSGIPGLLQLQGGYGTGKRFFLKQIATAVQRPVLLLDCEKWITLPEEQRNSCIEEMVSWAIFHRGIPALYHFFDFPGYQKTELSQLAQGMMTAFRSGFPLVILCGERIEPLQQEEGFQSLRLHIPAPTIQQQERGWATFPSQQKLPLSPELQPQQLATLYTLSFGQIRRVLALAEAEAVSRGENEVNREAVAQGVRQFCSHKLEALTEPMMPAFTWDDLEVDDLARRQLRELCDRIRNRWKVNEEWGFNKKLPYGKGISVCLYGPPGTGKTMTAQVLAREFGLDAYRVDMSRIMDKYIGETEKKLGELFDAAKDSNSILFFDEADALFAKRTEVGDSKDRYANVETAYLLQRMENHNGISILATNAMNNFDAAFKRRISYMISLPMPDAITRRKLWGKVFPQEAPLAGVDLDDLAQRFELTGSSIKNAALHAAYLAAAKGQEICQEDILRAIQTEYQRTGRILMEADLY